MRNDTPSSESSTSSLPKFRGARISRSSANLFGSIILALIANVDIASANIRYTWVGVATGYGAGWDAYFGDGSGTHDVIGATFTGWLEFPSVGSFHAYCDLNSGSCPPETSALVWSGGFNSETGAGEHLVTLSQDATGVLSVSGTGLLARHMDPFIQWYEVALDGGVVATAPDAPLGRIDVEQFGSATFAIGFQDPDVGAGGYLVALEGSEVRCDVTSSTPDRQWIAPLGGDFSTYSHWDPLGAPGVSDTACFDLNAAYSVTLVGDQEFDTLRLTNGDISFDLGGHQLTVGSLHGIDGNSCCGETSFPIVSFENGLLSASQLFVEYLFEIGELSVGSNAELEAGQIDIAPTFDGRVLVRDGGSIVSNSVTAGDYQSGAGLIEVTGPSSTWISGNCTFGIDGSAIVSISDGGLMSCASAEVGVTQFAFGASEVSISGINSTFETTGPLLAGRATSGRLYVRDGAKMTTQAVILGEAVDGGAEYYDGDGLVQVEHRTSAWENFGPLVVGNDQTTYPWEGPGLGRISADDGGLIRITGLTEVGPHGSIRIVDADIFASSIEFRGGAIGGAASATLHLSGDFAGERSAVPSLGLFGFEGYDTTQVDLSFDGNARHSLDLSADDLGASTAGYAQRFPWKSIRLSPGEQLAIRDADGVEPSALYLKELHLGTGLAQIPLIQSDGSNIYYAASSPENAYLAGGTYPLFGGGVLAPSEYGATHIAVYNTDLPPDEAFVKILEDGDVLDRNEVGSCPAFHTITTGSRTNVLPESLDGEFTYPVAGVPTVEHYNETNQPYAWPGDLGWFDVGAGIPTGNCTRPLTTEDGDYSITVTPYGGELVGGEPTGVAQMGLTLNFSIRADPIEVVQIEVHNSDLPPGETFVKVLEEGDILDPAEVGTCPVFHTVTTGPRDNSAPESLVGKFTYPSAVEYYAESNQPYAWPGEIGWHDIGAGIPSPFCVLPNSTELGHYAITVTPYEGELVDGEPTGDRGQGMTVDFYVPEPSLGTLLAAGVLALAGLRVRSAAR